MGKGPCLLGANLTDPYGRARFRASSQTFCPQANTLLAGDLLLAALFNAAMACFLRCLNWSTCVLAAGLSEFDVWSGLLRVLDHEVRGLGRGRWSNFGRYCGSAWPGEASWPNHAD